MSFRRKVQVGGTILLAFLSGCGSLRPKTFDVSIRRPVRQETMHSQRFANPLSAADTALLHRALEEFAWAAAYRAPEPEKEQPVSVTSTPSLSSGVTEAAGQSVWDCIAEAETGSDYTMHGSTYSTAFGMVNDIIYDYGTPEEQQAVFSGTASKETQIAIASRFANDHGFGGWGELTRQKCGL
jgi:hypothetical protein